MKLWLKDSYRSSSWHYFYTEAVFAEGDSKKLAAVVGEFSFCSREGGSFRLLDWSFRIDRSCAAFVTESTGDQPVARITGAAVRAGFHLPWKTKWAISSGEWVHHAKLGWSGLADVRFSMPGGSLLFRFDDRGPIAELDVESGDGTPAAILAVCLVLRSALRTWS
jgi:hypothetical protein